MSLLAPLSILLSIPIGVAVQTPAQAAVSVTLFAGTPGAEGYSGDGGPATSAKLRKATDLATDGSGNVYFAEDINNIVRKVDTNGIITTVRGTPQVGKLASQGGLNRPTGVAVSQSGVLYTADTNNNVVWSGSTVFAGGDCGAGGYSGDGGAAHTACYPPSGQSWAKLNGPAGLGYDDTIGALYIADKMNCRVRQVYNGIITTVAGNGTCAFSGDGGPATSASIFYPRDVAVFNRKLYIADTSNQRIRVVDLTTDVISTFAGTGSSTSSGDGGLATSAGVTGPAGLAVDPAGNVYIGGNDAKVRVVNTAGIISTVATLPAINGYTNAIQGITRDRQGNIYASAIDAAVWKISRYPTRTLNYVALGDSVAVGEGINYGWRYAGPTGVNPDWMWPNYGSVTWEGSGQLNQDCHRSYYAYTHIIADTKAYNLTDLACTGAATKSGSSGDPANGGILTGQDFGADGTQPAQLGQTGGTGTSTPNPAYDGADHNSQPDVVTLTVGMDDLDFVTILKNCYKPLAADCNTDAALVTQVDDAITHFQLNLDSVLAQIQARGQAASPVKVPHVYITGYYDPFGSSTACGDINPTGWPIAGLSSAEISWLKGRLSALNNAISLEASTYGSFATYVDISNVLTPGANGGTGHQLCDSDPWVYGPLIVSPLTYAGFWIGGNDQGTNPAPFHPTDQGQRAIANRVLSYMP